MIEAKSSNKGCDLPRRSYWIRLDSKSSRPWQRENFKHDDLEGWVSANRGRLIGSVLTLARAWIVAGKPSFEGPIIGGFTEWKKVVGGILANAGVKDFLGNIDQMHDVADEEGTQWETFLSVLHEDFCGCTFKTREILEILARDLSLMNTVPDEFEDQFDKYGGMKPQYASKLRRALKRREGTRYGNLQLRVERAEGGSHENVACWRIVCGECGICRDRSSQIPQKPENLQNTHIQHFFEGSTVLDPANPAIPAQTFRKCHTCGESNWRTHPNGNGEHCGTCHPL